MQITTVMVVMFLIWCVITLLMQRARADSAGADSLESDVHGSKVLGWLQGTFLLTDVRRCRHRRFRTLAVWP